MHKGELIKAVAEKAGITQEQAKTAVDATFGTIRDEVAGGGRVQLTGFGTFDRAQRPARDARNPQTGETITVPATFVPKFKVGADFRAKVRAGQQAA